LPENVVITQTASLRARFDVIEQCTVGRFNSLSMMAVLPHAAGSLPNTRIESTHVETTRRPTRFCAVRHSLQLAERQFASVDHVIRHQPRMELRDRYPRSEYIYPHPIGQHHRDVDDSRYFRDPPRRAGDAIPGRNPPLIGTATRNYRLGNDGG
jgi:hypothetical protein